MQWSPGIGEALIQLMLANLELVAPAVAGDQAEGDPCAQAEASAVWGPAGRRTQPIPWVALAGWLAVVGAGIMAMVVYSNMPGGSANPPVRWPIGSRLPAPSGKPSLVLFAHPHCPCTRSTLGELERLLTDCKGEVSVRVVFLKPEGVGEHWARTDLWRKAARIPGVQVLEDGGGREARLFRVETSGDVVVYDGDGWLMFHGGMTPARGHAGDSVGQAAILSVVRQPEVGSACAPVFGCPLFESGDAGGGGK